MTLYNVNFNIPNAINFFNMFTLWKLMSIQIRLCHFYFHLHWQSLEYYSVPLQ